MQNGVGGIGREKRARLRKAKISLRPCDRLTGTVVALCCAQSMATKSDKWGENVAGMFYVDQQCIDCDLCRETAPNFFTRHDEGGYSFVHKQPTTEEEISLCREALEGCPVEAIGEDGAE